MIPLREQNGLIKHDLHREGESRLLKSTDLLFLLSQPVFEDFHFDTRNSGGTHMVTIC